MKKFLTSLFFCALFALNAGQERAPFQHYQILNPASAVSYISQCTDLTLLLGGRPSDWKCCEMGDGNLNLIFVVQGLNQAVIIKQALPYVRLIGESWPLPLSRSYFEYEALKEYSRYVPEFMPYLYHHDDVMGLTVMQYLSPHIILRKGFIRGIKYPYFASHIGKYLAYSLYNTSDLHLTAAEKREKMVKFAGNSALCKISEDLIFDDPYYNAPLNRWTTPQLDQYVSQLQKDVELKLAAQEMKWRFLTHAEALIHGDLHTGSIMVTPDDTRVIDSEFAFYGPMGFDIGALFANILLAYFSQEGHASQRIDYAEWLLEQIPLIWSSFEENFTTLWQNSPSHAIYTPSLENNNPLFREYAIKERLAAIWEDALGFAGVKMIRRIIGLAHVEDFESITDSDLRAKCELKALLFARQLLLDRDKMPSSTELIQSIRK